MPVDPSGSTHWGTCTKAKDFKKSASNHVEKPDLEHERALLVDKSDTVSSDLNHNPAPISTFDDSQLVPLPILEDYEEDEILLAQQYNMLTPLEVGDRVRIVLAGSPLAHLTGVLGTVNGAETCGLIPLMVKGHGAVLLRREQLDAEPEEKCGTGETPQMLKDDPPPVDFFPGQKVTHRNRWLGKSERSPALALI